MGFGIVGAIVGFVIAFVAVRTQEKNVRRDFGDVSMRDRETMNMAKVAGRGGAQPSGTAEYGCVMVLLPALGFVIGLVISAAAG